MVSLLCGLNVSDSYTDKHKRWFAYTYGIESVFPSLGMENISFYSLLDMRVHLHDKKTCMNLLDNITLALRRMNIVLCYTKY